MEKLKLNLEHCYGIKKLQEDLDFNRKNLVVLYAANGTMKTSLANTLKDISNGKFPSDLIYGLPTICSIKDENDSDINKDNIIVINPFEQDKAKEQGKLMTNPELQTKYHSLHRGLHEAKETLLTNVKEQLKYSSRTNFDVEQELSNDYKKPIKEIYSTLKSIKSSIEAVPKGNFVVENLEFSILFTPNAMKFYEKDENHKLLKQYSEKYDELVKKSNFLTKGVFDHQNFANVSNGLRDNGFFEAEHQVIIHSNKEGNVIPPIESGSQLNQLLENEKASILNDAELKRTFEKISAEISTSKETKKLDVFLKEHPEFISELDNIEAFKTRIWIEVLRNNKRQLDSLIELHESTYEEIKEIIEEAKKHETQWHDVIKVFNDRFHVPFEIEPENLEDVILLDKVPSFKYNFKSESSGQKQIKEDALLKVLSTGERRAYYLLDLIYKIQIRKNDEIPCLLILDDIADSFDYQNKYAMIEYINDIVQMKNSAGTNLFSVVVLTHNFDFYRTIGARIAHKKSCYIAMLVDETIKFKNSEYLKNYFGHMKNECLNNKKIFIVAAIPFVRNLIEYTYSADDEQFSGYRTLTSLLHVKDDTEEITVAEIQDIYNKIWLNNKGNMDIPLTDKAVKLIYTEAKKVAENPDLYNSINIENKILMSMVIRLNAEKFMIFQITKYGTDGDNVIKCIQSEENQTVKLFEEYKRNIDRMPKDNTRKLQRVMMMTPENIHINSFMYEPILDMQGMHLVKLYNDLETIIAEELEA